jgi:ABC-type bacteriocin/lantibiotic exporter with double-glycine peptidase domain/CRP-like cAMP-binding protein
MNHIQALHLLSEDTLLAAMPEAIANKLKAGATMREIRRGAAVVRQGQPADKLIIPVDGSLRLVTRTRGASTTAQLRARRALNLAEVIASRTWSYSAFADTDLHVVEFDAAVFRAVLREAPTFARYLYRITSLPSVRAAANVLRRAGLHPSAVQRLLSALEERTISIGELVTEGSDPQWVLVDTGNLAVMRDDAGESIEVTALTAGEFYGGAAALGRAVPLQMRGRAITTVFVIDGRRLATLCAETPDLARVLRLEHPDVQRRVRRSFVEIGEEFTSVMLAVPPPTSDVVHDDDGATSTASMTAATGPATVRDGQLGRPWVPGTTASRRFDGFRCTLVEDSGAAGLASLLKYHDRPVSFASVSRGLRHRVPPTLLDLAQIAERQGLMSHAARLGRPHDLRQLSTPLLLALGPEYVVVHEVRRDAVRVFAPLGGLREVPMGELEAVWSGATLTFRDVRPFIRDLIPETAAEADAAAPADPADKPTTQGKRSAYLKLFGDVRGALVAATIVAVAVLALSVVAPRLNGLVVDQVLAYGDIHLLGVVAFGLILVHLSTFALSGFRDLCLAYLGGLMEHRLSSLALRHTLGISPDAHGEDRVGTTLARLGELTRIRSSLSTDVIQILLQVAKAAVYLVLVLVYSWKLGLIVTAAVPLSAILIRVGGRRYRAQYAELFDENARMQSQTTEQVEQVATIKALGGVLAAQRRWENTLVAKLGVERRLVRVQVAMEGGLELLEESVKIAAMYIGVSMVLGAELSPGALLAISQYTIGALSPLIGLAAKLEELAQVGVSVRKLDALFEHPLEDDEAAAVRPDVAFDGAIVARNLEFAYEDGPPVLRGINFEIQPGQTVAIVGRSGSGKTTLAKLLHGALRPTAGELLFDDHDSRALPLPAIRRNVGIVLQDSQLFAGTIHENIAYGDDRPDETHVREAARLAAAHDFIMAFPNRYQTYLAEGGLGLSGGQRQRICIARALYRAPRILVMDEATSALDAESERAIMANMRDILHDRTGIVIAHRLNTVKHADRILVVDQGEIVEDGTHDELVAKRGLYHSLFDRQFHQG